jgi:hypothetical protein
VKINRSLLALKVALLLTLFGATTFYFHYATIKKVEAVAKNQKTDKNACSQPLTEEESETQSTEEEQNDIRALHELHLAIAQLSFATISWATVYHPLFEEFHFEVITPPPQA